MYYLHEEDSLMKALLSLFLYSFPSCFSLFSRFVLSRFWRAISLCGGQDPWLSSSRTTTIQASTNRVARGTWRPTPHSTSDQVCGGQGGSCSGQKLL